MTTAFRSHLAWKIALIPVGVFALLGLGGLVMPQTYADFYLPTLIDQRWEQYHAANPAVANLILILFQANGLGMTMAALLALCIIWFACRKEQRWGWLALLIAGTIAATGDFVLEILAQNTTLSIALGLTTLASWTVLLIVAAQNRQISMKE
jgi:hypothetical protein